MANLASDGDINSNIENTSGCITTTALKYTQRMNVDTETNNKLILFLHFHKCGGSSIVNIFKKNNFQAYPINSNGNPKNEKREIIKYWNFDKKQIAEFVEDAMKQSTKFIALEWNYFNKSIEVVKMTI